MTAVTVSGRKEITGERGKEVVYISAVQDGYTFASKFGTVVGAHFTPSTAVACGASVSGQTVTIAVATGTVEGTLTVYGY